MTYWGLLGFFEPGELSAAPGSAFLAPFMLWTYLVRARVRVRVRVNPNPNRNRNRNPNPNPSPNPNQLIALVLFVNLLIAMFAQSYAVVMTQADENWKMKRVMQVIGEI